MRSEAVLCFSDERFFSIEHTNRSRTFAMQTSKTAHDEKDCSFVSAPYSLFAIRGTRMDIYLRLRYGNVLSQDETTYNYFKWFINTGDTFDGYHIQVAEGYYYPYNRGMFIGWS